MIAATGAPEGHESARVRVLSVHGKVQSGTDHGGACVLDAWCSLARQTLRAECIRVL